MDGERGYADIGNLLSKYNMPRPEVKGNPNRKDLCMLIQKGVNRYMNMMMLE